jgi:hypothetical protein
MAEGGSGGRHARLVLLRHQLEQGRRYSTCG